ncbi:MAG: hypothetical protein D6756_02140 [Cyanobacteria bacterium J083]|nr:MAG: hypothetical protein D6756_02140 [Cyanobacteria bacterium J083]
MLTYLSFTVFPPQFAAIALPPPQDMPEEILRSEIILQGRSPFDGKPLTAAEYAELEAKLAASLYAPEVNSQIKEVIFLLNLLKLFRTFTPL